MQVGDHVLLILVAKLACCALLVLGAAGTLGGLSIWLFTGSGRWLLAGIIIALIAALLHRLGRRKPLDARSDRTR
jgi:hypothetical protein